MNEVTPFLDQVSDDQRISLIAYVKFAKQWRAEGKSLADNRCVRAWEALPPVERQKYLLLATHLSV